MNFLSVPANFWVSGGKLDKLVARKGGRGGGKDRRKVEKRGGEGQKIVRQQPGPFVLAMQAVGTDSPKWHHLLP